MIEGYNEFIMAYAPDYDFGMFTEYGNEEVRKMLEETAYVIFTDPSLVRIKFADYVKKTIKKLYNSDSKSLAEIQDTEVEEEIALYLNAALEAAGHKFKLTRWNIQS